MYDHVHFGGRKAMILVIGSNSFLGKSIIKNYVSHSIRVIGVDEIEDHINHRFYNFVKIDENNKNNINELIQDSEYIFICKTLLYEPTLKYSSLDISRDLEQNFSYFEKSLLNNKKFVFFSTMDVENLNELTKENYYFFKSKKFLEELINFGIREHSCNVKIIKLPLLFGLYSDTSNYVHYLIKNIYNDHCVNCYENNNHLVFNFDLYEFLKNIWDVPDTKLFISSTTEPLPTIELIDMISRLLNKKNVKTKIIKNNPIFKMEKNFINNVKRIDIETALNDTIEYVIDHINE